MRWKARATIPLMDEPATPPIPTNADLARVFHEIGDMLEVKGELVFKPVAYHKAADAIAHSPVEVAREYLAGNPPRIAGVGDAIAQKIEELARTGRMEFYDRLREEVPPSLVALLGIPGVGPRTVKQLHDELGVWVTPVICLAERSGDRRHPARQLELVDRLARSTAGEQCG